MRRLLAACAMSVLFYAAAFGLLLDRPLSLGFLRGQTEAKLARGAALPSPKLVILAGSNGPYSHRCETIEPMLALPCVNAGVAVGIALDYLFARWSPLLRAGDVVYMPMEEEQYARTRAASALGPDAAIMWRHDRATLFRLPTDRWIAALFAFDLRAAVMSVIETALGAHDLESLRAAVIGETNANGDHVGHTPERGAASRSVLAAATPWHHAPDAIARGDGAATIAGFVTAMNARGVTVIGGLPTGFADSPPAPRAVAAIRAVYEDAGGLFVTLANQSRYPRADFFDTPDHLNEPCQIAHSRRVAAALAALLGRPLHGADVPASCGTLSAAR